MSTRLISADSHVAVSLDAIRERVPVGSRAAFDDATAEQARIDADNRRGRTLDTSDCDIEARTYPGYHDPWPASPRWIATVSTRRCSIRK